MRHLCFNATIKSSVVPIKTCTALVSLSLQQSLAALVTSLKATDWFPNNSTGTVELLEMDRAAFLESSAWRGEQTAQNRWLVNDAEAFIKLKLITFSCAYFFLVLIVGGISDIHNPLDSIFLICQPEEKKTN